MESFAIAFLFLLQAMFSKGLFKNRHQEYVSSLQNKTKAVDGRSLWGMKESW